MDYNEIPYGRFKYDFAKFVRTNHVNHAKHWMYGRSIVKNELRNA